MYLDKIIDYKKEELTGRKKRIPEAAFKSQLQNIRPTRDFKAALCGDGTRIIAEVKKASPSKGIIREDFDHLHIAKSYENAGAAAISVLTDSHFFKGSIDYLDQIRCDCAIPLLRKDFIIDQYQIIEARIYGADAILLIASVLSEKELERLYQFTARMDMQALVEVHNKNDLKKALSIGAQMIGINNRDLQKFKTDIHTTATLAKDIPKDRIVVSESGINSRDDIDFLKQNGAHAFLIGEALMREPDPGAKLTEFVR